MKPRALVIRTAGINCDEELVHGLALAGAQPITLHVNRLIQQPELIDEFQMIGFPGGFSYGDDISAGRIFANRLRQRLTEPLKAAVARGTAIIGICNGFQVLAKLGLLPDPQAMRQRVTLADNTSGRFVDRWVNLTVPDQTVCIWTRGLDDFVLPIAHGEGRFTARDARVIDQLEAAGQVALRYQSDDNPNGSVNDIAGICDPTGRVLGLMPHPERYVHPTQHPTWTRQSPDMLSQTTAGLTILQNAVTQVAALPAGTR